MIEKDNTFNMQLGKELYKSHSSKYSFVPEWESLSNDLKEMLISIALVKHKQTTVGFFRNTYANVKGQR